MKKTWKIILMFCLAVITCLTLASCGGEDEIVQCEVHTDADADLVCDVCQATLTPDGPTQEDLDKIDRDNIVKEMNEFLASGVTLINGDRKLPDMSAPVKVETNLPATHWVSRLNGFYIVDGRIKLTLENDNPLATAKNKDVYIGITPTAMYAIEDDTIELDYTTHLYTAEQKRVITNELVRNDIKGTQGTYRIESDTLLDLFSTILLSQTAQSINNGLYDRALIDRLCEIMKTQSEIKLNSKGKISSMNIYMYTEDNGLKTDICTINYTYEAAKQYIKISLNLNYIVDIEYNNTATSTFQVFQQTFKFHTEKPGDRTFKGIDVTLSSKYSKDESAVIVFADDIMDRIDEVEKSLFYTKVITEKYNSVYNIVGASWECPNVYVYDERYEVYILLSQNKSTSGKQVAFNSIEFDCDLSDCCLGTIDLQKKRVSIIQHSDEELIVEKLSIKYSNMYTASKTECLNVAVYDTEYNKYVLFKRVSNGEGGYHYKYNGVVDMFDETTTCLVEVSATDYKFTSFLQHNTNHSTH